MCWRHNKNSKFELQIEMKIIFKVLTDNGIKIIFNATN